MIVQGIKLQTDAAAFELPIGFVLAETEGALPEVIDKDGTPFLVGVDGKLHRRSVNTATGHAAILEEAPQPAAKKKAPKKKAAKK